MAVKEGKRIKIIESAFQKFTGMGFSHVTMDEIAKGVGIGKGTLYQYFPSKEILLHETIEYKANQIQTGINEIMKNKDISPLEKLNIIFKAVGKHLACVSPEALTGIEKNVPEAYEKIVELRGRIILTNLFTLFEEGKQMGLLNPDMDETLVAHILIGAADHMTNGKVLSTLNYSLDNLLQSITSTLLMGCLTEEGRRQVKL